MKNKENLLPLILFITATGVTGAFMICAGRPFDDGNKGWIWMVETLPFFLWAVSPFAVMAWLGVSRGRRWLVLMAALMGLAALGYTDAFIWRPDAQGGLLFLFFPFLLYVVMMLAGLGFYIADRMKTRQGVK